MNDKELLELAAKAAGMVGFQYCDAWGGMAKYLNVIDGFDRDSIWRPHKDDGDALRLAVELSLLVLPYPLDKAVRVTRLDMRDTIVSFGTPPDPCAATRRAIVRAAAEIGKGMS